MINKQMYELGSKRSVIRELFEFGRQLKKERGESKVFDFSLGNPSVLPPDKVNQELLKLISDTNIHKYTSAQGDQVVRQKIADSLSRRLNIKISGDDIYLTCGAAAGLTVALKAICNKDDEVIIIRPYFPEYKVFINNADAKFVEVKFDDTFQIDFTDFEKKISSKTKAVIINSPNNPSGAIYTKATIDKLATILEKKEKEYKHDIFVISDEPYRELVYDNKCVPNIMNSYDNTIMCYSFSKSLSLPGERIGYICLSQKVHDKDVYFAICGAGRSLGFICAPSIFQQLISKCLDETPRLEEYKQNRDLIYNSLTSIGYECVHPDGAFYLFIKSPIFDAMKFSEMAKQKGILLVPGEGFGAKDYLRLSYCVSYDTIKMSIPHFKELMQEVKGE